MKFWDSSALVALHIEQAATAEVRALYERDPDVVAWTLSDVELRSAVCRLGRDGAMTTANAEDAITRIEEFWDSVEVVSMIDAVKVRAKRVLDLHELRAADAMQLAAALTVAQDEPPGWGFVCLDDRLREAARRERFSVLP